MSIANNPFPAFGIFDNFTFKCKYVGKCEKQYGVPIHTLLLHVCPFLFLPIQRAELILHSNATGISFCIN